jgi:hypothetical protein
LQGGHPLGFLVGGQAVVGQDLLNALLHFLELLLHGFQGNRAGVLAAVGAACGNTGGGRRGCAGLGGGRAAGAGRHAGAERRNRQVHAAVLRAGVFPMSDRPALRRT